jgi:hypothetical protein
MKLNLIIGLCALFLGNFSNAQFTEDRTNFVTSCDCNTQLDEMYVKIPKLDLAAYDRIGVQVVDVDRKIVLANSLYTVSGFKGLNNGLINLLNPEQAGVQGILGIETGLFMGTDVALSYNKLCQFKKDFNIEFRLIGIKQVGTETDYQVSGNKVTAKTRKIFDGGTIIHKSEQLKIISNSKSKEKFLPILGYGIVYGTGVIVGAIMYPILRALR